MNFEDKYKHEVEMMIYNLVREEWFVPLVAGLAIGLLIFFVA